MGTHTAGKSAFTGALALSALTVGAIAAAGLGSAPTANATCASFFGISTSAECSSTPLSIAIAIGTGAQAKADGLFGSAFALGTNALAYTNEAFNFATAAGDNSLAVGSGLFGITAALGPSTQAQTTGNPSLGNLGANIALNISPGNETPYLTAANGTGNVALNLFGTNNGGINGTLATGVATTATNIGGRNTLVSADGGFLNSAFTVLGSGNSVFAGPGPLATAGSMVQPSSTVTKQQLVFNINGVRIPNTAAVEDNKKPKPAAATGSAAAASERGTAAMTADAGKRSNDRHTGRKRG